MLNPILVPVFSVHRPWPESVLQVSLPHLVFACKEKKIHMGYCTFDVKNDLSHKSGCLDAKSWGGIFYWVMEMFHLLFRYQCCQLTVWKFQDFSVTRNLREIDFGED